MGINTTICLYYSRNTYELTLEVGNYISSVQMGTKIGTTGKIKETYKVGQSVTISAVKYEATNQYTYSWAGWTSNNDLLNITNQQSQTITMPEGHITLTANARRSVQTYTVTCIDVEDSTSGYEIDRSTFQAYYNETVYGSVIGDDKTLGKYYEGYSYENCTSAKVTTSGATVYRIFKPKKGIYAKFYTDKTVGICSTPRKIPGKTLKKDYGDISESPSFGTTGTFGERETTKVIFVDKVSPKTTAYFFWGCGVLTEIENIHNLDTSNVTSMQCMFAGQDIENLDLRSLDVSHVTNMRQMFSDCYSLKSLDLRGWDTSSVEDMGYMFSGCTSLKTFDLSVFDTSSLRTISGMFARCTSLESIDFTRFDTKNVETMAYLFHRCYSLRSINFSNTNTSNVTSMNTMFRECTSLTSLDLRSFDTRKVNDMSSMFADCSKLSNVTVGEFWREPAATGLMFSGCGVSSVTR